jgi:hypothetical protein
VLAALVLLETYVSTALFPFHRHTYIAYPGSNGLFLLAVFMSLTLVVIGAVCFVSPKQRKTMRSSKAASGSRKTHSCNG